MTTALTRELEAEGHESEEPALGQLSHTSREDLRPHFLDPTQGTRIGSQPYDDLTQGRKINSEPHDDPTQGMRTRSHPYHDPTQGVRTGSHPYHDPTQGCKIGSDHDEDPTRACLTNPASGFHHHQLAGTSGGTAGVLGE